MTRIHIFHTNDIHSHFEHWPRMTSYVQAKRHYLAQKGEASFLVDIGDFVDRSNLFAEATLGKGCIQMLNDAQYDAVTIGNNEGITLSYEQLHTLYDEAKFQVIVSNLNSLDGNNPKWLEHSTILTTSEGVKIGVIGATAQYDLFYNVLGWQVDEPREVLLQLARQLKQQVDIVICLSHLGITEDELLAEQSEDIDVIFGAHTHHFFQNGKLVNETLLTGGAKYGQYVGQLTIHLDDQTKKIIKLEESMHESATLKVGQRSKPKIP